jgi:hypothetical protein
MNYLNSIYAAAALRISQTSATNGTLLDQVGPYLSLTPSLILDIQGVALTSMAIGELVNVVKACQQRWGTRFTGIFLTHVSDQSWNVLATARLTDLMRPFPTVEAACLAIQNGK